MPAYVNVNTTLKPAKNQFLSYEYWRVAQSLNSARIITVIERTYRPDNTQAYLFNYLYTPVGACFGHFLYMVLSLALAPYRSSHFLLSNLAPLQKCVSDKANFPFPSIGIEQQRLVNKIPGYALPYAIIHMHSWFLRDMMKLRKW